MARSDPASTHTPAPARRRRATWITVITVGLVSGSALLAIPAIAADPSPPAPDRVIVCESGVVDQGEIRTSSATADRVGPDAPVPDGCRER